MSLIHINNSKSITGQIKSIQLHSESHGQRYIDNTTEVVSVSHRVLDIADGYADVRYARYVTSLIQGMFAVSDRTLYSAMSMLSHHDWSALKITAEIEFEVTGTGHGEIKLSEGHVILLVKTTWQES